jgi:hypothetical protein
MDGSVVNPCVVVTDCQCCRASPSDSYIVVAEHTVPRTNVLASHTILVLLTADDDLPSAIIPGHFHPIFPINARKTQESTRTEKPDIARPRREAKNFCNIARRSHGVILYCFFLQLIDEPVL